MDQNNRRERTATLREAQGGRQRPFSAADSDINFMESRKTDVSRRVVAQ